MYCSHYVDVRHLESESSVGLGEVNPTYRFRWFHDGTQPRADELLANHEVYTSNTLGTANASPDRLTGSRSGFVMRLASAFVNFLTSVARRERFRGTMLILPLGLSVGSSEESCSGFSLE